MLGFGRTMSTLHRRSLLVASSFAALACLAPSVVTANPGQGGNATDLAANEGEDSPDIVGGSVAQTCQFPTSVLLTAGGGLCTGTLVDPEVVLYAAHCGTGFTQIRFGESFNAVGRTVNTEYCRTFVNAQQVNSDDYAFCKLASPVTDVPITPVVYGCETEIIYAGNTAYIAGFGQDESQQAGTKRWAQTTIGNLFQGMVQVGGNGTSAWSGDSGGPAFVQFPDGSFHAFGIVSGGSGPGQPVLYVLMNTVVSWVEEESGVDITPCHDVDGTWNPTPKCGNFATNPMGGGSWSNGCSANDPLSAPSETCGEAWNSAPDPTPPVIAITSPTDGATYDTAPATIDIQIDATDEGHGIRDVKLFIDGSEIATDKVAPYEFNGLSFPKGSYVIRAVATDYADNTAEDAIGIGVGGDPAPEPPTPGDGDGDGDGGSGEDGDAGGDGLGGDAGEDAGGDGAGAGEGEGDSGGCSTGGTREGAPLGMLLVGAMAAFVGVSRRRRGLDRLGHGE